MDMFMGFIKEEDQFRCTTCGKIVERGIISLSRHWADGAGKQFTEALMKTAEKKKLTLEDVEKLGQKHLKS